MCPPRARDTGKGNVMPTRLVLRTLLCGHAQHTKTALSPRFSEASYQPPFDTHFGSTALLIELMGNSGRNNPGGINVLPREPVRPFCFENPAFLELLRLSERTRRGKVPRQVELSQLSIPS